MSTTKTTRSASWKGRVQQRTGWTWRGALPRRIKQWGRWCYVTNHAGHTLEQWWEPERLS